MNSPKLQAHLYTQRWVPLQGREQAVRGRKRPHKACGPSAPPLQDEEEEAEAQREQDFPTVTQ